MAAHGAATFMSVILVFDVTLVLMDVTLVATMSWYRTGRFVYQLFSAEA